MSKQLEFDFGEEFKHKDKIVEVCPCTGQGITQQEIDDYHKEVMAEAVLYAIDKFEKEEKDAIKK